MSPEVNEAAPIGHVCPLCGSLGKILYPQMSDSLFGFPGTWDLYKCQSPECGLLYPSPEPTQEELDAAYAQYYTHGSGRETLARKIVKYTYFALSYLPAFCISLAQEKHRMRYLYLQHKMVGNLLDVGCGDGQYLRFMAGKGWKVQGLDSDPEAVEYARKQYGLNVKLGNLMNTPYYPDSFDAITLRHVLEHLPNPIETMARALEILRPGGRLVIVTPNSESLGHEMTGRYWRGLEVPRHLRVFSLTSLRACARQLGYPPGRFLLFSAATGADFILDESLALMECANSGVGSVGMRKRSLSWSRTLRAIRLQYHEQLCLNNKQSLRYDPSIGEEAVLILQKQ